MSKTRLRLLVVGNGWAPDQAGGLNRYVTSVSLAMQSHLESQSILVLGPAIPGPVRGVTVVAAASESLPRRFRALLGQSRRLRSVDLFVSHFALNALPIILRHPRLCSKHMVVHFHGPWSDEARAMGEGKVVIFLKRQVEALVYRRADTLIVLSEYFKQVLINEFHLASRRIIVVPPGVDTGIFAPRGAQSESADFVCVRRLVPRMGIDVLLRAWAASQPELASSRLRIVGDGPDRSNLQALASALGIERNVDFLGRVSDEDLATLYATSRASVVPSEDLEGFGLVSLESLSCGTPVIASDQGGLGEFVGAFAPDCTFPAGDVDALRVLLIKAAQGVGLPPFSACLDIARKHSWAATAEVLVDVYARTVSR